MTKVTAIGQTAEQSMQSTNLGRNGVFHRVTDRQLPHLLADGLGQARSGLAGRRGEANTQRLAKLHGRRLQQCQQPHNSGGFTGTGATGNNAEAAARCQRAGDALPVRMLLTVGKQRL